MQLSPCVGLSGESNGESDRGDAGGEAGGRGPVGGGGGADKAAIVAFSTFCGTAAADTGGSGAGAHATGACVTGAGACVIGAGAGAGAAAAAAAMVIVLPSATSAPAWKAHDAYSGPQVHKCIQCEPYSQNSAVDYRTHTAYLRRCARECPVVYRIFGGLQHNHCRTRAGTKPKHYSFRAVQYSSGLKQVISATRGAPSQRCQSARRSGWAIALCVV